MEFMRKILKDVVETINELVVKGCLFIDVARVREHLGIPTSDRSSIGFIAKSLCILARYELLELGPRRTPKQYKVTKSFTWEDVARLKKVITPEPEDKLCEQLEGVKRRSHGLVDRGAWRGSYGLEAHTRNNGEPRATREREEKIGKSTTMDAFGRKLRKRACHFP